MSLRPHAALAGTEARFHFVMRAGNRERRIEFGGRGAIGLLAAGLVLLILYLASTLYLITRDDLLLSLVAGQRRTADAYEDRITELRQRIDRITARQVMNQDSIEDRVADLVARQAELEARQVVVADVATRAGKAGLALGSREASSPFVAGRAAATSLPFAADSGKPRPLDPVAPARLGAAPPPSSRIHGVVDELGRRSWAMEEQQFTALRVVSEAATREITRSRQVIAALGLNPARFGKIEAPPAATPPAEPEVLMLRGVETPANSALGGPLISASPTRPLTEMFEAEAARVERALETASHARSVLKTIPVGRPLSERFEQTSGFGNRLDPFTRSLALHSGIDFRAPYGTPVKAVAGGKVIEAGWSGGYGRMVEIDHGFGITTRYAHLSSVAVKEGDRVEKGGLIGQVGSTGRSTGPHLHYEVRIDDDAANPQRFLRAGNLAQN